MLLYHPFIFMTLCLVTGITIRGSEWGVGGGGPLVGCRLKFSNFVGSRLKFSIFVGSRLNLFDFCRLSENLS